MHVCSTACVLCVCVCVCVTLTTARVAVRTTEQCSCACRHLLLPRVHGSDVRRALTKLLDGELGGVLGHWAARVKQPKVKPAATASPA
jgi:hypothetical protein